ncbi:hypothetical protein SLS60_002627 [Paraconiothyrium brasiliense]|uniref:Tetratricopeptide repeat protein n=1 Tax=Paraconiothyrium brasiliense TaxID=300254 RepID=A0ABR3RUR7_9PLEO
MADPFSFVAGGIGVADVVVRVIRYLKEVRAAYKSVEQDIARLIDQVERLMRVHQQLECFLDDHGNTVPGSEEHTLWSHVGHTLQEGRQLAHKLEVVVKEIYGDSPNVTGKRDGIIKQHRLRGSNPTIRGIRDQIDTHNQFVEMYLSVINARMGYEQRDRQNYHFQELKKSMENLERRLEPTPDMFPRSDEIISIAAVYRDFTSVSLSSLKQITASIEGIENDIPRTRAITNKHFYIPKPVDRFYTGRKEEARQLKDWLLCEEPQETSGSDDEMNAKDKRFVVHGVGGAGKTQFCCKFATQTQNHFWGIFWVDGSSRDRLNHTFAQNVSKIGGVDANKNAALNWLSNLADPWLLIIDNADDPDLDLNDYFPRGANRGHILITTRSPFNKSYGTVGDGYFEFHGLRGQEASCLLLKASEQAQPWDSAVSQMATHIAKTLGYLALAITQAGRTIRNKYCQLHEYVEYYERQWQKTRQGRQSVKGRDIADHLSVFATFELNLRAIEYRGDEASRDALQLLNTFAFLHNQNIRFEILTRAVTNGEIEEENEKEEAETRAVSPPLGWGSWLRHTTFAILAYLHQNRSPPVLPSKRIDQRMRDKRIGRLNPFPLSEPTFSREKALTYMKFSIVYFQNGRYDEAKGLQMAVKDFTMGVLGIEHPKTRLVALALANTMLLLGQPDDAAALQEEVLEACSMYLGPHSLETLMTKCKLAWSRQQQGRLSDAKRLLQEAVMGLEAYHGRKNEHTLDAKDLLGKTATLSYTPESFEEARKLHLDAIEGMTEVHGPQHDRTLTACENLCMTDVESGNQVHFSHAHVMMTEILGIRRKKLGREHGMTLIAMVNLARVKIALGDLKDAEDMLQDVLPIGERNYGSDHVGLLWGRFHLSTIWVRQERWREAERLLVDIVARQCNLLQGRGKYHPDRLIALKTLARVYYELGRLYDCARVADEALEGFNKINATDHPVAASLREEKKSWVGERVVVSRMDSVASPTLRSNTF